MKKRGGSELASSAYDGEQAAEFEQAELRGETPDASEVAGVVAAQASLVQRMEQLNVHFQAMVQQAEAVTRTADEIYSNELFHQFKAQFNIKENL